MLASIVTPNVPLCAVLPNRAEWRVSVCIGMWPLMLLPQDTYGTVLRLLQERRGEQVEVIYMESERVMMKHLLPWQEVLPLHCVTESRRLPLLVVVSSSDCDGLLRQAEIGDQWLCIVRL